MLLAAFDDGGAGMLVFVSPSRTACTSSSMAYVSALS